MADSTIQAMDNPGMYARTDAYWDYNARLIEKEKYKNFSLIFTAQCDGATSATAYSTCATKLNDFVNGGFIKLAEKGNSDFYVSLADCSSTIQVKPSGNDVFYYAKCSGALTKKLEPIVTEK